MFVWSLVVSGACMLLVSASWLVWWFQARPRGWLAAALLLSANLMLLAGVSRIITAVSVKQKEWRNWAVSVHVIMDALSLPTAILFLVPGVRRRMLPIKCTEEWQVEVGVALAKAEAAIAEAGQLRPWAARGQAADVLTKLMDELQEVARGQTSG